MAWINLDFTHPLAMFSELEEGIGLPGRIICHSHSHSGHDGDASPANFSHPNR